MTFETLITLLFFLILFVATAFVFKNGRRRGTTGHGDGWVTRMKAFAGDARAQYRLGVEDLKGNRDLRGFKWLLKSARRGHSAAQDAVGMMYEFGRGTAKDFAEAAKWYQRSASLGFVDAKANLGNLYALGRGVDVNYHKALKLLEDAAVAGSKQARNSLSWLLATSADREIRNGRRAIGILSPLVNRGERSPILLDTLAAAYAETGLFRDALDLVEEGIAKANPDVERDLLGQMERHKLCYQENRPWRETPQEMFAAISEPIVAGAEEWLATREAEKAGAAGTESDSLLLEESGAGEESGEDPDEGPKKKETAVGPSGESELETEMTEVSPHTDYIVEKLLAIEELLRPLDADEDGLGHEALPEADSLVKGIHCPPREGTAGSPATQEPENDGGHRQARDFADAFVRVLLAERYGDVYRMMERSFRTAVPESQLPPMVEQLYEAYGGRPLDAELKGEDSGYRTHGSDRRHVHKFWYALRNAGFERDTFTLFVEVFRDEADLVCSIFFITPSKNPPPG